MKRTRRSLSEQLHQHANTPVAAKDGYDGDIGTVISTGSTLLDLAISGGRCHGGGLPGGILVEIFGPTGCGKTVLLCEIAGNVQKQGGSIMFFDPEARLNKPFARLFGLDTTTITYNMPATIPNVFEPTRKWQPQGTGKIHGVFADSLAALSTEWEMADKDQYGMRRAKEFSEELRKTCRILAANNYLMVCSNQVRENLDAGPYGQRYRSPGGLSIGFYASLRLRCNSAQKIKAKKNINGKEQTRIVGVETEVEVYKSSVWQPYHQATVTIIFDYGIDDIRQNLQYVKEQTRSTVYALRSHKLSNSLDEACRVIEADHLERKLRAEVIGLWEAIELKFKQPRKPKHR
jgi:recombination protein RecA